eukprot:m.1602743 g.1602743  ORF g.1602743 m.1602743 type:complete len:69 (-) comp25354_c0_seq1:15592-15798(-)
MTRRGNPPRTTAVMKVTPTRHLPLQQRQRSCLVQLLMATSTIVLIENNIADYFQQECAITFIESGHDH